MFAKALPAEAEARWTSIPWRRSLTRALAEAKATGKPIYLFVNAMTTVSSVIFLYAPDTKLASVAAVNIEEAGTTAAAAAPITPPGGGTMGPVTNPAGKAVGVGFWQGGWMTVHAAETIYAPRGTTVRNARESARDGRGGTTIVNNVTINRQVDEAALLARLARQVRRAS